MHGQLDEWQWLYFVFQHVFFIWGSVTLLALWNCTRPFSQSSKHSWLLPHTAYYFLQFAQVCVDKWFLFHVSSSWHTKVNPLSGVWGLSVRGVVGRGSDLSMKDMDTCSVPYCCCNSWVCLIFWKQSVGGGENFFLFVCFEQKQNDSFIAIVMY